MKEFLRFNSSCIACLLDRFLDKVPDNTDAKQRLRYNKEVLKIIGSAEDSCSAPEIVAQIIELKNNMFGYKDDYSDIKEYFNRLMLNMESELEQSIHSSGDSLRCAVKFAMLGNYIDFGALRSIDEQRLHRIPEEAKGIEISEERFCELKEDLSKAGRLVYITDNCGEIVADKLLIRVIRQLYPSLDITVLVRGKAVLNDATAADAAAVGLSREVRVMENGTGIAGTVLDKISAEAVALINSADVIISKGQGNFETLQGCEKNIYYLFLCKCRLFAERFGKERLTGMFLNDIKDVRG